MRKHPLIALTAFTALTASAIAGASTGTFNSTAVLTSARTTHRPSKPVILEQTQVAVFMANDVYPAAPFGHTWDRAHARTAVSVPVVHKAKPKPNPPVVEAVAPAPVVVAPPPAPVTTTVPQAAPAGGVWYELRMCESGGNYAIDTGNGYYGAYQFALSTWYGLGFSGLPSDAAPAVQDEAAAELQARSGWGQWPTCSAELGL
jgi:hypothetical protein